MLRDLDPLPFTVDPDDQARTVDRADHNDAEIARWRTWLQAHLEETLALDDAELGRRPEVIYWLFPIGSSSKASPDAPVIGCNAIGEAVAVNVYLRFALLSAFARMLAFYGIVSSGSRMQWANDRPAWVLDATHDRRVSRILHCLHSAGLRVQAQALMGFLEREFAATPERLKWWWHQVAS